MMGEPPHIPKFAKNRQAYAASMEQSEMEE